MEIEKLDTERMGSEMANTHPPNTGPKKKPLIDNGFLGFAGGNGGIRTLDEALHPILP
jgi:hypothetical protein